MFKIKEPCDDKSRPKVGDKGFVDLNLIHIKESLPLLRLAGAHTVKP